MRNLFGTALTTWLLALLLVGSSAFAAPSSSANFNQPVSIINSGIGEMGSANFTARSSVGDSFNMVNGSSANFTNKPGFQPSALLVFVPPSTQTLTFNPPASVPFATAPFALSAVASSGLAVTFATTTPATCTVNAALVTIVAAGTCSVTATQAGNANYQSVTVTRTINIANGATLSATPSTPTFGQIMTLTFTPAGTNPTGTVSFINALMGAAIPGCSSVPVVNGSANCLLPSSLTTVSSLQISASYSGDAVNPPASAFFGPATVQTNAAVLTTSSDPVNAVRAGSQVIITALVGMRNPVGSVSFYPENFSTAPGAANPVALPGCDAVPITMLPNATDSAIAKCALTAPLSGNTQVVAFYRYPAGHLSNRVFELEFQPIVTLDNLPANFTDMWWGGIAQNGWGVSITQHGAIQFNVIFAYDNAGKPTWYVMPGCVWSANNTVCTGSLYYPSGSPFAAYDVNRFAANAPVGTVSFTYKTAGTATMAYTINGISGTKEIERQLFANPTTQPTLQVNDIWWNGVAENGWGINITQQGRQLFPVWYTYDALGKPTFYAVPGGTWNGLVFTGDIYTTISSPWLGVPYDASKFVATKVGTMVIDYRDANTATMTYTIGDVTQTKLIVRQPY